MIHHRVVSLVAFTMLGSSVALEAQPRPASVPFGTKLASHNGQLDAPGVVVVDFDANSGTLRRNTPAGHARAHSATRDITRWPVARLSV